MLDPAAPAPLHRQIYTAVRNAILDGQLEPGASLPSTRTLALVPTPSAGMTLIAWLHEGDDDVAIAEAVCRAGVAVTSVSNLAAEHRVPPGLLLGYSGVRPNEIREGMRVLATAIAAYDAAKPLVDSARRSG